MWNVKGLWLFFGHYISAIKCYNQHVSWFIYRNNRRTFIFIFDMNMFNYIYMLLQDMFYVYWYPGCTGNNSCTLLRKLYWKQFQKSKDIYRVEIISLLFVLWHECCNDTRTLGHSQNQPKFLTAFKAIFVLVHQIYTLRGVLLITVHFTSLSLQLS